MEKRVMGIFWRPCVALIALTFTAIAANAQLVLDGGFEAGPGGPNWTVFNGALQMTNNPHSGVYSLYTAGPFGANFDASGAYQLITTGLNPGQTYTFTGWFFNPSADPMGGTDGFAMAQIVFTNTTTTFAQTLTSLHFGVNSNPIPQAVWQKFEVTGTMPVLANAITVEVMHVGKIGDTGSIWWDDLVLYQNTGQVNTNPATSQSGVQISWPTSAGGNSQAQASPTLSSSTVWTNFGPEWQGTGGTNQIVDVIGAQTNKFYKIISVQ